jgi:hypothetical protein
VVSNHLGSGMTARKPTAFDWAPSESPARSFNKDACSPNLPPINEIVSALQPAESARSQTGEPTLRDDLRRSSGSGDPMLRKGRLPT